MPKDSPPSSTSSSEESPENSAPPSDRDEEAGARNSTYFSPARAMAIGAVNNIHKKKQKKSKKNVGFDQEGQDPSGADEADDGKRPNFKGQLSEAGINFNIPSNAGAKKHVQENHGKHSCRFRALEFIHSRPVQVTLMSLLLLDVIIIFIEIFLIASYPPCQIIRRDGINCCPVADEGERFLAGGKSEICEEPGFEPIYDTEAGCDSHQWHVVHTAEEVLFVFTLLILFTFWTELHIEMWALGIKVFFRQFFFALDYVIITVSLALEILFHVLSQTSLQTAVGLLLVVRIWRFLRIAHGIVEVTHEVAHHEYNKLLAYTEELEEIVIHECDSELPDYERAHIKRGGGDLLCEIEKAHRDTKRQKMRRNKQTTVAPNDKGGEDNAATS